MIYKNILEDLSLDTINEMKTIHFTADLHHGHPKIINICNRPIDVINYNGIKNLKTNSDYKSKLDECHTNWLIQDVINKWVNKKDTLFILGDVSLSPREQAEKFIDKLNGNKFLILGNHDKNIKSSTRFSQITQIKDFTYSKDKLNIHIVLSHYPILSWNRKIHGSWHLFGHCHCRPLEINNGLSFDVGIDRLYKPYNLYEICKIMIAKEQKIYNDNNLLYLLK